MRKMKMYFIKMTIVFAIPRLNRGRSNLDWIVLQEDLLPRSGAALFCFAEFLAMTYLISASVWNFYYSCLLKNFIERSSKYFRLLFSRERFHNKQHIISCL